MPEHQQTQQSKNPDFPRRRITPASQIPISNPMAIIQRARINPKSLTHADVVQLQRTIGNRAVGKLLSEIGLIPSKAQQAPVQRQEISKEEEPPQGKLTGTIQRQEPEEEEKLQMKSVVQRQEIPEEKGSLQGEMIETIQRQEITEEEEPFQGKFESNSGQAICPSCSIAPIVQRKELEKEKKSLQGKMIDTVQRQEIPEEGKLLQTKRKNNTGMPDDLKAGVENLSGISMSNVRVHYNSSKPAEVGALAYTQGSDIHVVPGQERHLPHEAWHVVQQAQGRVQPTMQLKDVAVNDDVGLEREADVMGEKASLQRLESMNELPNTMEKENKRVQSQVMCDNTLVQFKINWDRVNIELIRGVEYREPLGYRSSEAVRDDTETKMLIEELKLRYPNNNLPTDLVDYLKTKIIPDSKQLITYKYIQKAITQAENELNLPITEKPQPDPQNEVERFVIDLKNHRGYYNWEHGTHDAFIRGLNSQDPSKSELPEEAEINCWEAVLFSAARTGLIAVDKIKKAYSDKSQLLNAVEALITQGATTFTHYCDQNSDSTKKAPNRSNNIKMGDVIVMEKFSITDGHEGEPEKLDHVVAAIKECREDYMKVEVMSLWVQLTGNSFNQVTLGDILKDRNAVVKYSSLSQSNVERSLAQSSSTPLTRQEPPSSSFIPSTSQLSVGNAIAQPSPSPLTAPELPSSSGSSEAPEKSKCRCTLL